MTMHPGARRRAPATNTSFIEIRNVAGRALAPERAPLGLARSRIKFQGSSCGKIQVRIQCEKLPQGLCGNIFTSS
jgi:hypothetical protein